MRVFLIVIAVLGIAFYAVLIWGGSGETPQMSWAEAREQTNGSLWGRAISVVGDRFAPKLELSQKRFDVVAPARLTVDVPRSSQSTRIAKFALIGGEAIEINYQCPPSAGPDCPKTLCVTRSGQSGFGDCTDKNTSKAEGSLIIHAEGGWLTFQALQGAASAALQ